MSQRHKNFIGVALVTQLVCFSPAALAYLDPSTGSMILSAIVGVFATVGLAVKTYWYKLKSFFTGSKSAADPDDSVQAGKIHSDSQGGEDSKSV